ncbi:MAG: molybdopterin-dependent oxidoreductase, partial [Pseudomonadota bacterium]
MALHNNSETGPEKVLPSVCPLDCPDTCSLNVTVVDNRVVKVRGSKANPFTAGSICSKVAKSYPEFVHGENRLRYPLLRVGAKGEGKFERISWDEALDRIHLGITESVKQFGAESVVPFNYSGPHGKLAGGSMDRRFFHKLGASQLNRGALCAGTQDLAFTSLYGDVPGMPPEDAEHSALIVVWGVNVTVSNLHMQRVIQRARKRGAILVVVDPKRIKVAEQADLHLAIRPGTDVLLAMGVAAELERRGAIDKAFNQKWSIGLEAYLGRARGYDLNFVADTCGITRDELDRFVDWYATLSPASMMVGVAVERTRNGGSGVRAAAALPALAGKFGVRGGGLIFGISSAFPFAGDRLQ